MEEATLNSQFSILNSQLICGRRRATDQWIAGEVVILAKHFRATSVIRKHEDSIPPTHGAREIMLRIGDFSVGDRNKKKRNSKGSDLRN
jgi:hypothetical protein